MVSFPIVKYDGTLTCPGLALKDYAFPLNNKGVQDLCCPFTDLMNIAEQNTQTVKASIRLCMCRLICVFAYSLKTPFLVLLPMYWFLFHTLSSRKDSFFHQKRINNFSYFAKEHRLWVFIRSKSVRNF